MKKFFIVLFVIFSACGLDDETDNPVFCTEEFRPGLVITVKEANTDVVLIEGVNIIVRDGDYIETLRNFPNTDNFTGAFERKGTYTLTATKDGYQPYISDIPIEVDADLCHVITERKTIALQLVKQQ